MTTYCFLQPLDVLYLRGNKLFDDPGSFGESLVPPWPSVAAGALRSRILADDRVDPGDFAAGRVPHPTLGTPHRPGSFRVTDFHLARCEAGGRIEGLFALPADLVLTQADLGPLTVERLKPHSAAAGIQSSAPLAKLPLLAEPARRKTVSGFWLTQRGWARYLAGETPAADDVEPIANLWKLDTRIGVGLDAERRRADDGKLFTGQAVALTPDLGFLVGVRGAEPSTSGTVRLGGDGRAAAIQGVEYAPPAPDVDALLRARRCRIVLTTPGLFAAGWRLPGSQPDGHWQLGEVSGRLVCAAVPRAEVVSGWDLARWQPKTAQRAVPAGSVYWIEDLHATTPDALRKLAEMGLWSDPPENPHRRAEGFNRFTFAVY
ncbi:type III-B CRISPR module-associated Cmr3 family protein [Thioalkalicoccus limnaeus]|uniref:Type III-B CRISPR module-associated Cmr3 family protein n=1 Tax=Thioalkalicoccus limnaeus TaxID=120681 RepID=A0ABV4BJZ9_9GAMM